jgi:hypothetical protein
MIQPSSRSPAPGGDSSSSRAFDFLTALDHYAANFDLMVSAWKQRDIYDVVSEEFVSLVQRQKASFPDAAVVMVDLVIAHNDVAVVLLDFHKSLAHRTTARFQEEDMQKRLSAHAVAVLTLRSYMLGKTH